MLINTTPLVGPIAGAPFVDVGGTIIVMSGRRPNGPPSPRTAGKPAPILKVHGTYRSGSNYLKALLELNYDVDVRNGDGGFKHAPYPAVFGGSRWVPPPVPVLVTVKDPYSWLTSMWRYMNGKGARHTIGGSTWERFLHDPLIVFDGDSDGFPRFRFADPIDYWNAMYYNLLSLDPRVRHLVRYRDSLTDPIRVCDGIAKQFGLARSSPRFIDVRQRVRNMADRPRSHIEDYVHESPFDPTYYLDREYLNEYSPADRRWVRHRVDSDIAALLGYPV